MYRSDHNPRLGVVVMAYPGNNLGDDHCESHIEEFQAVLTSKGCDAYWYPSPVLTEAGAREAGHIFKSRNVDVLIVILTSFVPDYFVVELTDACDQPVFLWSYEWSINSLSIVGGMLVTGALNALKRPYLLKSGMLTDEEIWKEMMVFASAAMLKNRVRENKIGVSGGKNNIMLSMAWDEFEMKRRFGVGFSNIAIEEFYDTANDFSAAQVEDCWQSIQNEIGRSAVTATDGCLSSRYYLAAKEMVRRYGLSAYSINCYPALKSQICLAVAKMNDEGIAAGCEGDVNSTFMMLLLHMLSGEASFNGDFLWMYRENNSILFSHCGAGAFSLAQNKSEISLIQSIETCDGCAVCYPVRAGGDFTLLNMMVKSGRLNVYALKGKALETDLTYCGTPVRIGFERDINDILHDALVIGTGHHWSGGPGDRTREIQKFCELSGVKFTLLS